MSVNPLLAIDTSTEVAGVALLGDSAAVALSWDAGRNQTTTVLDQVDRCLALAGIGSSSRNGVSTPPVPTRPVPTAVLAMVDS